MRLALQLLTFNRPEVLSSLFDSLAAQTDQDWVLFVLDNSTDANKAREIAAFMEKQKERMHLVFEHSSSNTGFDGGHQHLYELHDAAYVMCINDDAILESDFIARMRRVLDEHPRVAAAGGKILRWNFDAQGAVVKTDVIDSLGLKKTPWHSVYDIGAGGQDQKIPYSRPDPITVFGVSGCLPMYRRAAVGEQLFDPSYFMYKEDVDLSYRFAASGWQVMVDPGAVAYHKRTFSFSARKQPIPFFTQWLSWRNHWRNLCKHLTWKDWLVNGWMIIPYEVAKFGYLCYKYPVEFPRALTKR